MPNSSLLLCRFRETVESLRSALERSASVAKKRVREHAFPGAAADLEACNQEHRAAWKHVGYPGLCEWFVSSDRDLTLRRFEELNVRVILKIQDDIVQRERELKHMDAFTRGLPDDRGSCGSLRLDADTPRGYLLDEIAKLLADYSQLYFVRV